MSNINQVFIEADSSAVSATMPSSTSEWDDFLINELLKKNKQLSGKFVEVEYTKRSDESRTAIGNLTVKNSDKKKIMHVPFVIKNGDLKPVDMFYRSGSSDPVPLSSSRIREAFFRANISSKLSPYPSNGPITDDGYSDYSPYGQYSDLGTGKHASVYDEDGMFDMVGSLQKGLSSPPDQMTGIMDKSASERFDRFDEEIDEPEGAFHIENLRVSNSLEPLRKIAMHKPYASTYSEIDDANSTMRPPLYSARIIKVAANNYSALLSYADGSKDSEKGLTTKQAGVIVQVLGGDVSKELNEVEKSGQRIISALRGKEGNGDFSLVEDIVAQQWAELKDDEFVKVNAFDPNSNVSHSGYAWGAVYGPNGKKTNKKLFVNPGQCFSVQKSIAVEYIEGGLKDKRVGQLTEVKPEIGEYATYVFGKDRDKKVMLPFKITGVTKEKYGDTKLDVEFVDGSSTRLVMSYGVKMPTKASNIKPQGKMDYTLSKLRENGDMKNTHLIPSSAILVGLAFQVSLSDTVKSKNSDKLMSKEGSSYTTRITANIDGGYRIDSPMPRMRKEASESWGYNPNNLSDIEAFHILVSHGASAEHANHAVKTASQKGISESIMPQTYFEEDLEINLKLKHWEMAKEATIPVSQEIWKMPILKMAAAVREKNSVSNILQLRLFGPETFRGYINQLPKLEKTVSFCCSLLLASRLGSEIDIDEAETASTVRGLDSIIDKVKEMRPMILPN